MEHLISDFVDACKLQDERKQMRWEDDRSHLIEQADKQYRRMKRHTEALALKYDHLANQIEAYQKSGASNTTKINDDKSSVVHVKTEHNNDKDNNQRNNIDRLNQNALEKVLEVPAAAGHIQPTKVNDQKRKEVPTVASSSSSGYTKQPKVARSAEAESYRAPYIETVRNRAEREGLPGHICVECSRYYEALAQQGILFDDAARHELLLQCSRHKARYSPPHTPNGFWDLDVNTPRDWK